MDDEQDAVNNMKHRQMNEWDERTRKLKGGPNKNPLTAFYWSAHQSQEFHQVNQWEFWTWANTEWAGNESDNLHATREYLHMCVTSCELLETAFALMWPLLLRAALGFRYRYKTGGTSKTSTANDMAAMVEPDTRNGSFKRALAKPLA